MGVFPRGLVWRCLGVVLILLAGFASSGSRLGAQSGGEALFLLLPVGARAVGTGEAAVAQHGGGDGVWWNPASAAWSDSNEFALHHSETVIGQGNAFALVLPTSRFGVFTPMLDIVDLEQETATDDQGLPQGVITPTNVTYGLSYAIAPAPFLTLGVTAKHVELRIRCSGLCTNLPAGGSSSNGVDVGTQVQLGGEPVTLGFAARNLGVGMPHNRPGRLDFGVTYQVGVIDQYVKDLQVNVAAGVVSGTALDSGTVHVGGDVAFERRIHVRGGYIIDRWNGSGAAIGFGIVAGSFSFDLARTFGGIAADGDKPPTYFSLRYLW